jgi:hypothetical protein
MGDQRTHTRSFGGGEVTPEFFGRIDDAKYQTGLALCRNFVIAPHGPAINRPGTLHVNRAKNHDKRPRLIPFTFSFDQALVIEISEGAFRFHAQGQTLEVGGSPYEVAHPYLASEIPDITYAQSGDVVHLRHRNHPRRTLSRFDTANWVLDELTVGPVLEPPENLSGTATAGDTPGSPFDTEYVVTALTATEDESLASAVETVSNNLYDDGAYNTLSWDAVPGAERYNIYKKQAGLFGYIGQTAELAFADENIAPDLGTTPPLDLDLFEDPGDYPGAVTYFEQRLFEAATLNQPQNIWGTRSATENNFNYSIPLKENDSIHFKIASREANPIYHLVAMQDLIALTPSSVWRVSGGLSDILSPLSLTVRQQSFVGSSLTKPALIGNNMIYVASRGGHLRELGLDGDKGGYLTGDVSIRAPHLFDGYDIERMTVAYDPYPIVWSVSSSGKLIGFTYIPEQQVGAFHQHDTDGIFEEIVTIPEGGRDVTYVSTRRTVGGATRRFIEVFADRNFATQADQHFVDCGIVYTGTPTAIVDGLDHLEGKTVAILADGAVVAQQEVQSGMIELPVEASVVHVGLPYTCDLQTLPLALELAGYGQGMPKNVNTAFMRVYRSSGIFAGPSFDELVEHKQRTIEPMGSPPNLITDEVEIVLPPAWTSDGQICVRQSDPIALTLLSITLDFALGGG